MSALRKVFDPRVLLGLASIALVVAFVMADLSRTSPGPLSSTHAAVSELAGGAGCAVCHGDGGTTMASACLACHDAIATQLDERSGFHGSFEVATARECAACHLEHHGDELPLAGSLAFARAGVDPIESFAHDHVLFELHGRHTDLACVECHEAAEVEALREGQARFLGADQACASCHEDPHEGRYSNACATCHGQEHAFATVASFAHGDAFPLVGAHGRPGCAECHPDEGERSIGALALAIGADDHFRARRCADCHDDPHRGDFVAESAAFANVSTGDACTLCHDAVHDTFATDAGFDERFHALSGFDLDAPHDALDCDACHARDLGPDASFGERFPGRMRDDCAACHDDAHGGQFDTGSTSAFAGAVCIDCHTREAFAPHGFDLARHGATEFPLTGAHASADCASCHVPDHPTIEGDGDPLVFADAGSSCSACHTDPHGGIFAGVLSESAEGCASCHTTTAFDAVADFDHADAHFELLGAHATLDCAACHAELDEPDALGRTFAHAAVGPEGPEACGGCHADAHQGRFDERLPRALGPQERAALAQLIADRRGCARCHTETAFTDVRRGVFDHGAWTGYALDGAHDAIACQACHGDGARFDDGSSSGGSRRLGFVHERFAGDLSTCATCHADPHGGAFDGIHAIDAAGRTGCARCHTTDTFELGPDTVFDHGLWTGFRLEASHAQVACADCHTEPRKGRGNEGVAALGNALGLVPGRACNDCHADPHVGQFATRGRTDCASCHPSPTSFKDLAFDHDTDSRFPLDAQHAKLDCAACHTTHTLPGGGEVVRYKPLGTNCADCHGFGGGR